MKVIDREFSFGKYQEVCLELLDLWKFYMQKLISWLLTNYQQFNNRISEVSS
jgi:hypothetical protein